MANNVVEVIRPGGAHVCTECHARWTCRHFRSAYVCRRCQELLRSKQRRWLV